MSASCKNFGGLHSYAGRENEHKRVTSRGSEIKKVEEPKEFKVARTKKAVGKALLVC